MQKAGGIRGGKPKSEGFREQSIKKRGEETSGFGLEGMKGDAMADVSKYLKAYGVRHRKRKIAF